MKIHKQNKMYHLRSLHQVTLSHRPQASLGEDPLRGTLHCMFMFPCIHFYFAYFIYHAYKEKMQKDKKTKKIFIPLHIYVL